MLTVRREHVYELVRHATNQTHGRAGDTIAELLVAALVLTTVAAQQGLLTTDERTVRPVDLTGSILLDVDEALPECVAEVVDLVTRHSIIHDGSTTLASDPGTVQ